MASIRSDALQLAVNFHNDDIPTIAEIWEKAAFFEAFILTGAEGTRERYATVPGDTRTADSIAIH
jgi:hypothetical protein